MIAESALKFTAGFRCLAKLEIIAGNHRMSGKREASFPLGTNVTADQLEQDPYAVYARLRPREPISWLPVTGMYYALTHELVQQLLLDDINFVVGWETSTVYDTFGLHMMSCEGIAARRQKRPLRASFLPSAIRQNLEPVVTGIANQLVDGFAGDCKIELRTSFASRLPILVMLKLFGLPETDEYLFRSWYDDFESALANEHFGPAIRSRGQQAVAAFHNHLQPVIDAARQRPPDGTLLSTLVHDGHDIKLSDEEIRRNALIVMFGGISTVEALILNTLWILAHHPNWLETARCHPESLNAILEESIRLIGPVQSATRLVAQDVKVAGVHLKKGDIINLILSAANHDPAVFEAPDEFHPDRPNISRHLGFAAGPHLCLGMHLARTEGRIALQKLFERLPGLAIDLTRTTAPLGTVFRQPQRLTLTWKHAIV
jgi:cytochrome P450